MFVFIGRRIGVRFIGRISRIHKISNLFMDSWAVQAIRSIHRDRIHGAAPPVVKNSGMAAHLPRFDRLDRVDEHDDVEGEVQ
jgi:hypothetical protein